MTEQLKEIIAEKRDHNRYALCDRAMDATDRRDCLLPIGHPNACWDGMDPSITKVIALWRNRVIAEAEPYWRTGEHRLWWDAYFAVMARPGMMPGEAGSFADMSIELLHERGML